MLSQKLLVLFFGLGTAAWQQCINAASASSHLASVKENPNTWENKGFVEANFSSMPEPVVNDPDCHVGLLVYQSYNTPNDTNLLASEDLRCIDCGDPLGIFLAFFSFHTLKRGADLNETLQLLASNHLYHVECALRKKHFVCDCGAECSVGQHQLLGYVSDAGAQRFENFALLASLPRASQLAFFVNTFKSIVAQPKILRTTSSAFFRQMTRFVHATTHTINATPVDFAAFWTEVLASVFGAWETHATCIAAIEEFALQQPTRAVKLLNALTQGSVAEFLPENKPILAFQPQMTLVSIGSGIGIGGSDNFNFVLQPTNAAADWPSPSKQALMRSQLQMALHVGEHAWPMIDEKLHTLKGVIEGAQIYNAEIAANAVVTFFSHFSVYLGRSQYAYHVERLLELLQKAFDRLPELHAAFDAAPFGVKDLTPKQRFQLASGLLDGFEFYAANFKYLFKFVFGTDERLTLLSAAIGLLSDEEAAAMALAAFGQHPAEMQAFVRRSLTRQNFAPVLQRLLVAHFAESPPPDTFFDACWKRCVTARAFECCSVLFPQTAMHGDKHAARYVLLQAFDAPSAALFDAVWNATPPSFLLHHFALENAAALFRARIGCKRAVAERCDATQDSWLVANYLECVFESFGAAVDAQTIGAFDAEIALFSEALLAPDLAHVKGLFASQLAE